MSESTVASASAAHRHPTINQPPQETAPGRTIPPGFSQKSPSPPRMVRPTSPSMTTATKSATRERKVW
ncbi:hypothetical protein BDZ91DRAFT_721763 [Kalaharituber pfeilii]|nr:hypothetical protein BDZ91DRAFT_721763 [Kalaharituber pfeilii]